MEFLKDALGEELYRQVEGALHGNERIKLANLADGGYVSKDKFSSESEKLKEAQRQLQERDTQLVELRESAAGNDELHEVNNNSIVKSIGRKYFIIVFFNFIITFF